MAIEQPFIFLCWDKVLSGSGYVRSVDWRMNHVELYGMNDIYRQVARSPYTELNVSISAKTMCFSFPNSLEDYKPVGSCTIDELIVALRKRINQLKP